MTRLIARLDVKNEFVIKGVQLEGLRKIGNPVLLAKKYYEAGVDEIIFMDSVASLYGRNNLFRVIEEACKEIFIPITIGGGLRTIEDIEGALKAGADKVSLNTQAIKNPEFVKIASRVYGSQCIIGSVEAKRNGNNWEAYIDNGRERTGIGVVEWAHRLEDLGIGEILLTSIDKDGTKTGFELELIEKVCHKLSVPIIVSGGAGNLHHISEVLTIDNVDALAIASMLHYEILSVENIKNEMIKYS